MLALNEHINASVKIEYNRVQVPYTLFKRKTSGAPSLITLSFLRVAIIYLKPFLSD